VNSRKATRLYKLPIWASAAGMVVLVMAINWQRSGNSVAFGAQNAVPAIILASFWIYFLRKSQVHLVADCGNHLEVQTGKTLENVLFSNIASARVSTIFDAARGGRGRTKRPRRSRSQLFHADC
jgi:hypothetical protein